MKRTVYLPVEVQRREWKAKLYLASKLLEEGYSVVIGKHYQVRRYALTQQNGIYIDKSFFYNNSIELRKLKERGFQILAWDEEGIINGDIHTYISQRVGKETLDVCDVIFTWGEKQSEYIRKFYPEISYKIKRVGNPRIDILRKENKKMYQHKIQEIHKKYGNFILVNTNFLYATNENIYEQNKRMYIAQQKDGGKAVKILEGQIEKTKKVFELFIEGIEYLANNIPQTIIIRPHPTEDVAVYKSIFGKYNNVHITNEYEVNVWIHGATATIHNSCTSGLESFIALTPTIAFLPDGLYTYEGAISNQVSRTVTKKESMLECIRSIVSGELTEKEIYDSFFPNEKWDALKKYVEYSESKSSSEMILDNLDKGEINPRNNFTIRKCWEKAKNIYKDLVVTAEEGNYKWRKLNFISIKKELNLLFDNKGRIKVYPVGSDVYFLGKGR